MHPLARPIAIALFLGVASAAPAQTGGGATSELLTAAELEKLVAPVALYPDTLLIQVLVAATYPTQIVKADQILDANAGAAPEVVKPLVEAENFDPSVAVLATAFPDVVSGMADHIDWTRTMGDAMLAQDEDVLAAVQVLRNQAINTGALVSGDAQTITYVDNSVVVQPTDPNVVYVPQYDPQTVYVDNTAGDVLLAGAIAFGTYAVIDAIFDDDDYWGGGYWGCRNCGGWGGGPIIRNPDIDIDVDGNVNIGNKVNIGNNVAIGDRPGRGPDGGWQPDPKQSAEARERISQEYRGAGATTLPASLGASRGDEMRASLANRSGAADISRPGNAGQLPQVDRPATRPAGARQDAIARTGQAPAAGQRPAVKKPAASPAAAPRPAAARPAARNTSAIHQRAPAGRAQAASGRGRASGGGGKARR